MDFVRQCDFRQTVERHKGELRMRRFSCWDQFLCLAFVRLTYFTGLYGMKGKTPAAVADFPSEGFDLPLLPGDPMLSWGILYIGSKESA
jgi:hypothetical protein